MSSHQEEDPLVIEAEESLSEQETRKRSGEVPKGRKQKRRKFCLLEEWGESASPVEEHHHPEGSTSRRDWLEEKEEQITDTEKLNQTKISSWLGSRKEVEVNTPGLKKNSTPKRMKGKLTKKEIKEMKECDPDVSELLKSKVESGTSSSSILLTVGMTCG